MCDYDGSMTVFSEVWVAKTRKARHCSSCSKTFPAGSRMLKTVGVWEGEFGVSWGCQACHFAFNADDTGPLHLCWGWPEDFDYTERARETWDYIRYAIDNGEVPTEMGLEAALEQHRQLETSGGAV